jgi:hypothetical protein
LGVDESADAATIDRAYKARIRFVHPDIAGTAGLNESKRLNVAREWLLDAGLRAQLPRPRARWPDFGRPTKPPPPPPVPTPPEPPPTWTWQPPPGPTRPSWTYEPLQDDPLVFDYGRHGDQLRAFFDSIRSLNTDERARLTYCLGDEPPLFFDEFKGQVNEVLWERSRALQDAIGLVWREGHDEEAPLLFPRGRVFGNGPVVANAYAQWMLLGDAIRLRDWSADAVAALASRCTWPWTASVGHLRYGSAQQEVEAFLADARSMSFASAQRLSKAWQRHMGKYLYGRPGDDWFPGSRDFPKPQLVSARLAAVDASRIEPPEGLDWRLHNGFRYGLRLTAHVLGLGAVDRPGRDYLRPWRDAMDASPSFIDRARWGMPLG